MSEQQTVRLMAEQIATDQQRIAKANEALAPCSEAEIEAWETWANSRGYDMHEHPLHYLFMDTKTDAARQGWKAGVAFALDQLRP